MSAVLFHVLRKHYLKKNMRRFSRDVLEIVKRYFSTSMINALLDTGVFELISKELTEIKNLKNPIRVFEEQDEVISKTKTGAKRILKNRDPSPRKLKKKTCN